MGQLPDSSCPCHLQDNVDDEKVKKVMDLLDKNSDQPGVCSVSGRLRYLV